MEVIVGKGGMHHIGEVVDAAGLSLRTIEHYAELGLVPPSGRSRGRSRLYTDEDIQRLRLVKLMKPLGFSLEEMRDLLAVCDRLAGGIDDETDRDMTLGRLSMYTAVAEGRVERLQEELRTATAFVDALRQEAARSARSRPHG